MSRNDICSTVDREKDEFVRVSQEEMDAYNRAAEILGNKPGTLKRSYANPYDIKPVYE